MAEKRQRKYQPQLDMLEKDDNHVKHPAVQVRSKGCLQQRSKIIQTTRIQDENQLMLSRTGHFE